MLYHIYSIDGKDLSDKLYYDIFVIEFKRTIIANIYIRRAFIYINI